MFFAIFMIFHNIYDFDFPVLSYWNILITESSPTKGSSETIWNKVKKNILGHINQAKKCLSEQLIFK